MRVRPLVIALAFAACGLLGPSGLAAGPFARHDVPPDLATWIPWVLDEVPDHACAVVGGEPACEWPGALALDLAATGGGFELAVSTNRALAVALPGDESAWPEDVVWNGTAAVVLEADGRPVVWVGAGEHVLRGRLTWTRLPEMLAIPPATGRVALRLEGAEVAFPRRDAGVLWLQTRAPDEDEGDRLDVEVYRHVQDGVPLTVTTRLVLRVGGRAREVSLGPVLLTGTVPVRLTADVPARLDADGTLRTQVRGGVWTITVEARTDGVPDTLSAAAHEAPWPTDETWVWQTDDALRQVTLTGAPGVDPERTNLPAEWRGLPAFLVTGGAALALQTTRRGEPAPAPDRLTLTREAWLDLDGAGFTVQDHLQGALHRSWRLDLAAPAVLGRVAVDGTDQLVTANPDSGAPGVEVRRGALDVTADSRLDNDARVLPAVGWSHDVDELAMTLHLPPGWTLLSASGVDTLHGTWVESWTLLGFFVVLLVALATGKLFGWTWGLIALLALVACYETPAAPFFEWIALLATAGLLRVLPAGRLRWLVRVAWGGAALATLVVVLPYAVQQIRTGLYPQIGAQPVSFGWGDDVGLVAYELQAPAPMEPDEPLARNEEGEDERRYDKAEASIRQGVKGKMLLAEVASSDEPVQQIQKKQALQQDPNAVVQTGPGVPTWRWSDWRLGWNGPVEAGHEVQLYLLSPGGNLALALLRVLLCLALAAALLRRPPGREPEARRPAIPTTGAAAALLLVLLAPAGLEASPLPDASLLGELRTRLTRPPECRPACTDVSVLDVSIEGRRLRLSADVHAGEATSWRLPGPARNWTPATVRLDGREMAALALFDDGFVHARVPAGRHRVEAEGAMPPAETLTLELGDAPHRVTVRAPGWEVDGLGEDGRPDASLQLSRRLEAGEEAPSWEQESLPPWLLVTRSLDLGLPWLVHTQVTRRSPTGSPVVVRVPLLAGESVTEAGLRVEAGHLIVSMGRDDDEVSWSSTLPATERLELSAPTGVPWTEVWRLNCSAIWQCAAEGLAPTTHVSAGQWSPTWHPWPGEKVTLSLRRPSGVEGQSLTLDGISLDVWPGTRLQKATLDLQARSSQGGPHTVTLPTAARVQVLQIDGRDEPIHQAERALTVNLAPGAHRVHVEWQEDGGLGTRAEAPDVNVGAPAVNVQFRVHLPEDRWLLFAGGPAWGPAVLFWGALLAAVLAAVLLGRLPMSPLPTWQWLLLAPGLVLVPPWTALVVVGWFLAFERRRTKPSARPLGFDATQVVLVAWTVAFLASLYAVVHVGLLLEPDMQVSGAGSSGGLLAWYVDRVDGALPRPWALSLPLWTWKALMLAWSLWLATGLVRWLPWAWRAFSAGQLWSPLRKKTPGVAVPPTAP
jgi:hypothetical protein